MVDISVESAARIRLQTRRMRVGLFSLSLALLAWLPFQNIVVALLIAPGIIPPGFGQGVVLLKELALVSLLAALVVFGKFRHWQPVDRVLLAFVIWCALYIPLSDLPVMARLTGMRMLIMPVLVYFLGRFTPVPPKGLVKAWGVLLLIYSIVALFGLIELLFIPSEWMAMLQAAIHQSKGNLDSSQEDFIREVGGLFYSAFTGLDGSIIWVRRMMSTLLEPLALGHILILPLLFLLCNFVGSSRIVVRPRQLVGYLFVVLGLAQVLSLSRGAVLSTLLGFGFIALIANRTRWRSFVLLLLLVVVGLAIPPIRNYAASTLSLADPSARGHVYYFQQGIESLLQHPMGEGLGKGGYVEYQYASDAATALTKNEGFYFSVGGQVGVVGLALFGLGLLMLLSTLYASFRRTRSPWLQVSALAVLGALAGHILSAVTTDGSFGLLTSGALFFMAGVVVQSGVQEKRDARHGRSMNQSDQYNYSRPPIE